LELFGWWFSNDWNFWKDNKERDDMKKLVFACGAYLKSVDETDTKVGGRLLTFVNDSKLKIQRPMIPDVAVKAENLPEGSVAPCLLWCPAKVKDSKRKVQRVYIGNSSKAVLSVSCRVAKIEEGA
jgi:hypothetical protein